MQDIIKILLLTDMKTKLAISLSLTDIFVYFQDFYRGYRHSRADDSAALWLDDICILATWLAADGLLHLAPVSSRGDKFNY